MALGKDSEQSLQKHFIIWPLQSENREIKRNRRKIGTKKTLKLGFD